MFQNWFIKLICGLTVASYVYVCVFVFSWAHLSWPCVWASTSKALVKANGNLLELSQWSFKLHQAGVLGTQRTIPNEVQQIILQFWTWWVKGNKTHFVYFALLRAQGIADAFVAQMGNESESLRRAKDGLEKALASGNPLHDMRAALDKANEDYRVAATQIRKHVKPAKPQKAAAKAAPTA